MGLNVSNNNPEFMICPKCRAKQPIAEKCSRCGIIIERYKEERRKSGALPQRPQKSRFDGGYWNAGTITIAIIFILIIGFAAFKWGYADLKKREKEIRQERERQQSAQTVATPKPSATATPTARTLSLQQQLQIYQEFSGLATSGVDAAQIQIQIDALCQKYTITRDQLLEINRIGRTENWSKTQPMSEPVSVATSVPVAPRADLKPGQCIMKAGYLIAVSEQALSQAVRMINQKDREALNKLMLSGLVLPTKDGVIVMLEKTHLFKGTVEIRPMGETAILWTMIEAIDCK